MFEAIQRADRTTLRALAKSFLGIGNEPAALLCLDNFFSSPLKLRDLPLPEVQALLSLYLDYIRLLKKIRRDDSLGEGSNRQRLFGFRVQGGNRYLVPEHTLLHKKFSGRFGSSKKDTSGHEWSYGDLHLAITQLISSWIHDRTEMENNACCEVHGFSPCLRFLVQNKCSPPRRNESCAFQHIQPKQLTDDWYDARVRLILLQLEILDLTNYCERDVKEYVLICFG